MTPDHDLGIYGDGRPKPPPPQGEDTLLSPSTGQVGDGAGGRILVVAPQPFYGDRGTPIALRKVLEALSQLAYQVDVLTFPVGRSPDIPGVRYFRVANPLRIRAVPIGFSFRKLWLDVFLFFALRKRLREQRYLCIHAVEEGAFIAMLAARRHDIPVIYDMQSSMAEEMARKRLLNNRPARAMLDACERWLLRNADHIVSSLGLAEHVRARAPEVRVLEWWYAGAISEVAPEEVEQLRKQIGISPGRPVVLYTGTFEEYQGLSTLIDAIPSVLSRIPHAVFVLIGADGPNDATRELASRVPADSHRVLERQPQDLMPAFLAMANVVVSPRTWGRNLPLKILEYLASGCAIVATSIPAHQTLLNKELAVLSQPSSLGLAIAITELLEDPARVAKLQAAAQNYAGKHLSWIGFIHSVGELYEEVRQNA